MGDILTVCFTTPSTFKKQLKDNLQLRPTYLPKGLPPLEFIKACKEAASVTCSGTVTSKDTASLTFIMKNAQYIPNGSSNDFLHVQGLLDTTPKWGKNPEERLPIVGTNTSFTGHVEDIKTENGKPLLVVLLTYITYLRHSKEDDTLQPLWEVRN